MTRPQHLIIFDVDGTLVDSQGDIVAAMTDAFQGAGVAVPQRENILSIVGLSLDVAMARLAPELDTAIQSKMVQGYKDAYMSLRAQTGAAMSSPLYPGAAQALADLGRQVTLMPRRLRQRLGTRIEEVGRDRVVAEVEERSAA